MNQLSGLSGSGMPSLSEAKNGNFFTRNYILLVSALLPAAVLFAAYIIFGIYPFGERSVLSLDLNAQYVYYFDYMYDVLAGKESLFYCWSRNLSGEFAGIIGYYLASPFNWIVWAFPRKMITEGLMAMMVAKAGAAGLTSAILLKKQRGYSNCTAVTFSVMYALCGFFIVQTMNPMWLDGLLGLPLVIMGIERLCEKKSFALYVLSLLYVFVTNFYIGYMIGIFSALYFVYFILSNRSEKIRGASVIVVYGFSSLAAILMSCFMIMPVYMSLSNGKFAFSTPDFTPVENFNIADIFIKLFPATYDTVRMEGLPILYCGTLALVMAAAYFASRRFSARERVSGGILIGILVLSMYIRPIDMLWHGGQMPNWLPYRYSFFVIFLLWIFGAQAFDGIKKLRPRAIGTAFVILLGMLLYSDCNAGHEFYDTNLIIVIPLLLLAVMSIMAAVYKKFGGHMFVKVTITVLVSLEMLLNTALTLFDMDEDIIFSDRSTYLGTIPYSRKITDAIHEMDDGFYRMEKTYHRCVNDPIALRMYGMSHSSSTLNSKAIQLLKSLGFSAREHYTRYDGATMLTDDIFGVKYVLSQYKCYVPYENKVPIENELNVTVYKNEDALGIAYLADKEIIGYSFSEYSPFLSQNRLASMLTGNKALTVFRTLSNSSVSFDSHNITVGETTDAHSSFRKINDGDAWISYDITMPESGAIYMYLPTDYERETQLYINDQYLSNYYMNENYSIEYLGTYDEGETFNLRIDLLQDALYFKNPQFYYIDSDSLQRFVDIMGEFNEETSVEVNSQQTELNIEVNAEEDCALFTTIPYEKGWTAYVDGEAAEIKASLDDALICLDISKGSHSVTLRFFPAGLELGLIFSSSGAMLFLIMLLISAEVKRHARVAAIKNGNEPSSRPDIKEDNEEIVSEDSDSADSPENISSSEENEDGEEDPFKLFDEYESDSIDEINEVIEDSSEDESFKTSTMMISEVKSIDDGSECKDDLSLENLHSIEKTDAEGNFEPFAVFNDIPAEPENKPFQADDSVSARTEFGETQPPKSVTNEIISSTFAAPLSEFSKETELGEEYAQKTDNYIKNIGKSDSEVEQVEPVMQNGGEELVYFQNHALESAKQVEYGEPNELDDPKTEMGKTLPKPAHDAFLAFSSFIDENFGGNTPAVIAEVAQSDMRQNIPAVIKELPDAHTKEPEAIEPTHFEELPDVTSYDEISYDDISFEGIFAEPPPIIPETPDNRANN